MNTITLLRSKGLTDDEIMEVISARHAKALWYAYAVGWEDGMVSLMSLAADVVALATESNEELSA